MRNSSAFLHFFLSKTPKKISTVIFLAKNPLCEVHPPRWMERARKMPFYDSGSIPASIFPPGIGYPQRQALDTEKRKGGGGGMQLPACELAKKIEKEKKER